MFIKVTRTATEKRFQMLIPITSIAMVCTGYESGSRVQLAENRVEIEVEESVAQIWAMMKEMK